MLSRPIILLLAVVVGLACCLPMIQAASCNSSYCATTPVYHAPACAPVLHHDETPVFVSPFEPLDVFVFIPTVAVQAVVAAPVLPPAGGPITKSQDSVIAAFPKAHGWAGRPAKAVFDLGPVAAALTRCTGCHTAPTGKKGINLFAANGAFDPKASPAAILASVESDSMPLRGAKLTPTQKKLIADWVAATKGT